MAPISPVVEHVVRAMSRVGDLLSRMFAPALTKEEIDRLMDRIRDTVQEAYVAGYNDGLHAECEGTARLHEGT